MLILRILLFRHGESIGNREQRMPGHFKDSLTRPGKMQTQRLGQALADQGWIPTQVYTSPSKRSLQTAEILMTQLTAVTDFGLYGYFSIRSVQ